VNNEAMGDFYSPVTYYVTDVMGKILFPICVTGYGENNPL
jgi:hypothetical protein